VSTRLCHRLESGNGFILLVSMGECGTCPTPAGWRTLFAEGGLLLMFIGAIALGHGLIARLLFGDDLQFAAVQRLMGRGVERRLVTAVFVVHAGKTGIDQRRD